MIDTLKPYECTACGSRMFARDGLPRNTYECENDDCGQRSVIVETGLKTLRYDVPRIVLPQTEATQVREGVFSCPHCACEHEAGTFIVCGLHWECPSCEEKFMRPKASSARGSNESAGNPALDLVRSLLPKNIDLSDDGVLTVRRDDGVLTVRPEKPADFVVLSPDCGVNPGSPEDEGGER